MYSKFYFFIKNILCEIGFKKKKKKNLWVQLGTTAWIHAKMRVFYPPPLLLHSGAYTKARKQAKSSLSVTLKYFLPDKHPWGSCDPQRTTEHTLRTDEIGKSWLKPKEEASTVRGCVKEQRKGFDSAFYTDPLRRESLVL